MLAIATKQATPKALISTHQPANVLAFGFHLAKIAPLMSTPAADPRVADKPPTDPAVDAF